MHVTDWFPTILRLAGAPKKFVSELDIDGMDQYDTFFAYDATGDDRYFKNTATITTTYIIRV